MNKTNTIIKPPVVVVLGHVDHGKSSILEAIWDLKITERESGGITQHIAAYEIEHQGKKITFIDTPGHEAFSAMRKRGAKAADIAVLVVASDEGVKEQTKEAIKNIKEAELPIIVAINKTDKPEANPEKVKRELSKLDIQTESLGGKVPSVNLSAKTKEGISDLLDLILILSEMEGLKADTAERAKGFVIESFQDAKKGIGATIILEQGILKAGGFVGTDSAAGKARTLEDFQGKKIDQVLPGSPALIMGFESIPLAGETFQVFSDLKEARENLKKASEKRLEAAEEGKRFLNLIVKADVQGSLEAISQVLSSIPQEKAGIRIIKQDVGEISESDLKAALSSEKSGIRKASVVGFRVGVSQEAKRLAEKEGIKIKTFDIIYELGQAVKEALEKILESETIRQDWGKAKILAVFRTDKSRQIIGGKAIEGQIKKGSVEVFRNEERIGKGRIISLQRDKKETDDVKKGTECGILYEGDAKVQEGDVLLSFFEEKKKAEL